MNSRISPRDQKNLCLYLDGQLTERKRIQVETRFRTDPAYREALDDLRRTRLLLRSLPRLRAPHNFTLSPATAGIPQPSRRSYPIFGLVSALASLFLVLVIIGDYLGVGHPAAPSALEAVANPQVGMQQAAPNPNQPLTTTLETYPSTGEAGSSAKMGATEITVQVEALDTGGTPLPPSASTLAPTEVIQLQPTSQETIPSLGVPVTSGTLPITPTATIDASQVKGSGMGGPTDTPEATPTATPTPEPSETCTLASTDTPQPTATREPTATPSPTTYPLVRLTQAPGISAEAGTRNQASEPTTPPTQAIYEKLALIPVRLVEISLALVAVASALAAFILQRRAGR